MRILPVFILFSFLFQGQPGFAQQLTQTIRGTVIDKESRQPLPGASVLILGIEPARGAAADDKGRFRIEAVPVGRYDLRISYIGYNEVLLRNIELSTGKEVVLNVEMTETVIEHKEVVITANKPKDKPNNEMAVVSARMFTVDETKRYAGSLNDPARMAANFAGVSGANDSRNDIIIRGNSPSGLLWRLEGVDIPNPNHFAQQGTTGGPVSILNNNLLANSDFFTGAFPAEYGDAVSGVFDLRMRPGNNEKREYTGQIGFNGIELMAEGPLSKDKGSSYLASYRYSDLILFEKMGINLGPAGVPKFTDLSFKLNFPSVGKGQLEAFGIGGISYISVLERNRKGENFSYGVNRSDVYFGTKMGATGISYTQFLGARGYWRTTLSTSAESHRTHVNSYIDSFYRSLPANGEGHDFYDEKADYYRTSIHSVLNQKFSARNTLKTGIIFTRIDLNITENIWNADLQRWLSVIDKQGATYHAQAYSQWKHDFSQKFSLLAGVHTQYLFLNNTYSLEPRAGLRYYLSQGQSLNFGYGLHGQLQPMVIYYRESEIAPGAYKLTNKDIGLTHSQHFVLGYDLLITKDMRLKAETYYQHLFDVPVSQRPTSFSVLNYGADFVNPQVDSLVNKGTGRNYGLEVTLERFFSKRYYFLLTASVFDSRYKGSDGIERNTAFNSHFTLNGLFGKEWKVGKSNTIQFDWKTTYAGGRYFTPVDTIASQKSVAVRYVTTEAFSRRYPNYFKADLRIGFKMNRRKFSQEWALDIQNVTNAQNILTEVYDPQVKKVKTEYQLGRFPTLLYRIQF